MQRIFLKPWSDDVAEELYAALREAQVYRFIPRPAPVNAAEFCKRHRPDAVGPHLVFSAHTRGEAQPAIGIATVTFASSTECELGFLVAPAYWGKGLATQIIRQAISEISAHLGKQMVKASVDSQNLASIRALQVNGFTELERRDAMLKWQASVDVILTRTT